LLAATGAAARAAEQVTTAYQFVTIASSTPLWVAKDAGFFERQGLDVKIVFVEGSPRTLQMLIAGESQIVESTGPAVTQRPRQGRPWSTTSLRPPTEGSISLPGNLPSAIQTTRFRHELCGGPAVCKRARAKRLSEKPKVELTTTNQTGLSSVPEPVMIYDN
jgi:hypothetical protein